MRILLLTPPMTQLNTPYPATAYLKGFLGQARPDLEVAQADPAIELVLKLFSRSGLEEIATILKERGAQACSKAGKSAKSDKSHSKVPDSIRHFMEFSDRYATIVGPVLRFLQGRDPSLALRISSRDFIPEGPRFQPLLEQAQALGEDPTAWAFGALGVQDRAKYLASLMIDDLADVIREGIDPRFALSRYGEKLAASNPSFDDLQAAVESDEPTLVDRYLDEITAELIAFHRPDIVGLTVPFPGNVYGALRMAKRTRALAPATHILLGGGYVNTELRELADPRIFDYVDFIPLDDGERPTLSILEHLEGKRPVTDLFRTMTRVVNASGTGVVLHRNSHEHDIPHRETGTPSYAGLPLDSYLSLLEMLNPMHRVWSDGRWNKLTLAHGCYWKKCNFCDVSLDYIGRYDAASADVLVDRIERLVAETGQTGFHFVDEAAPPAILKAMAERLLARGITITWWGNIRFEKTFTPELAELLARSGCVAVSGGLEVASDRLLKLMNKGVTVEQVARVTQAFTQAGVLVHAYLMYGFPTQTTQETVDALERVRQLFAAGCLQSAYWHRFSATCHSPIGLDPARFGIRLREPKLGPGQLRFARNDLPFVDDTPCDHDALGAGLRKALYNFMHGIGLDQDVRTWFEGIRVARPKVSADLVERAIR